MFRHVKFSRGCLHVFFVFYIDQFNELGFVSVCLAKLGSLCFFPVFYHIPFFDLTFASPFPLSVH